MPDLIQSLQDRDLGHLRIVASLWGLTLVSTDMKSVLEEVRTGLLDPGLCREVIESLPQEAALALQAMTEAGGRLPWPGFTRRFGEIREVGPGRRDREQVYLNPISAAEVLFYRALLGRAFFDTPGGPQEFAFVPDDLLPLIQIHGTAEKMNQDARTSSMPLPEIKGSGEPLGRLATPIERTIPVLSNDRILDDACSLLAARRSGETALPSPESLTVPERVLVELLETSGILENGIPLPEPARDFLAASRAKALSRLVHAWLTSPAFNELHQLPGLLFEGEWSNQPLPTRRFLLSRLAAIPPGQWWSLNAFVRLIKEKHADFQRPAGDYDSWFIRRASDGVFLRGFAAWDEVDGALVRYLITGPLHWLGILDLALPDADSEPSAFRFSAASALLLRGESPSDLPQEDGRLHVTSQGRIAVPRLTPRLARYQIARFCDWEQEKEDEYRYRITPSSLKRAVEQGVKVEQLLGLLQKYAAAAVPPVIVRAIQRWEKRGTEARLEARIILRLSGPEVLEELRRSSAGRFLGEALGPAAVVVNEGAQGRVLAALAEMGLLAEDLPPAEGRKGEM